MAKLRLWNNRLWVVGILSLFCKHRYTQTMFDNASVTIYFAFRICFFTAFTGKFWLYRFTNGPVGMLWVMERSSRLKFPSSRMCSSWSEFFCFFIFGCFVLFHFLFCSLVLCRESAVHCFQAPWLFHFSRMIYSCQCCWCSVFTRIFRLARRFAPNSCTSCWCEELVLEVILFAISTCVLYSSVLSNQNLIPARRQEKITQVQSWAYESLTKSRPTTVLCFIIANHRSNGWLRQLKYMANKTVCFFRNFVVCIHLSADTNRDLYVYIMPL